MKKIDFLRRFVSNEKYNEEKNTLPYPSICLTNNEKELWVRGITSQNTVVFTSNCPDAIVTIDEHDYPMDGGSTTVYLNDGNYSYTITKGESLKNEYNLNVYPTALNYDSSGGSKTVDYTASTVTYSETMTGTLTVDGDMIVELNFSGTTSTSEPTWEYSISWITNNKNVFTAAKNTSKDPRQQATISAKLGDKTKTITVNQSGDGKVVTSYTYSVSNISTPTVAASVTTANITYIGTTVSHYADGTESTSNEPLNQDVTFSPNTSPFSAETGGTFDWLPTLYIGTQPKIEVDWTVKQLAGDKVVTATTYSVSNITSTPTTANWSDTAATINFIGTTTLHYNDGSSSESSQPLSSGVTFDQNTGTTGVTRTGSFTWQTETVNWSIPQDYNHDNITATTYSATSATTIEVDWNVTTTSVTFVGTTILHYADPTKEPSKTSEVLTHEVSFDKNTGTSVEHRTGSFTWQTETVNWQVDQNYNGRQVTSYTYSVTLATGNTAAWDATTGTVNYDATTTSHYADGSTGKSTQTLSKDVTFSKNDSASPTTRTGTFNWLPDNYIGTTQPTVEVSWTLDQDYNPDKKVKSITYLVSGVTANPSTVYWDATASTINFKGVTATTYESKRVSYSEEPLSSGVTFDQNTGTTATARTGSFTWQTETVNWSVNQGAHPNDVTGYTYRVENITMPTTFEWNETSGTVTYDGITILHYYSGTEIESPERGLTTIANWGVTNTTSSPITRSGTNYWLPTAYIGTQPEIAVAWSTTQKVGKVVTSTTYSVENVTVTPSPVAWNATSATCEFVGITTYYYADGTSDSTSEDQSSTITFAQNTGTENVTRTGSFPWPSAMAGAASVDWSVLQKCKGIDVKGYNASNVLLFSASTDTLDSTTIPSSAKTTTSKVEISSSINTISNDVFKGWTNLKSVKMMSGEESNIKTIGNNAFSGCTNLSSITLSNTVESIGTSAFTSCGKLTTINDTNTLSTNPNFTTVNDSTFYYCSGLTSITIPSNVTSIGEKAFMRCFGLKSINFNEGLTSIGTSAFTFTTGVNESIDLPNTLTTLGEYAFHYCGMPTLTLPTENLTVIPKYCFSYCSSLTEAYIPSNIKEIKDHAFRNNSKSKVTIENGVTSIGISAFESNYKTYSYYNSSQNTYNGQSEMVIPESVTTIGNRVFADCTYLPKSKISSNIETISSSAFTKCENMVETNLQYATNTTLKTIGDNAYSYCYKLDNVVFPDSTINLYKQAFYYCSGMTSINITKNIYRIGDGGSCGYYTQVFSYCSSLATVTVDADNTTYYNDTNNGVSLNCCLYKGNNKHTTTWSYRGSVCFGGNNPTFLSTYTQSLHVGPYAFEGNIASPGRSTTKIVYLPNCFTEIEEKAFFNCNRITMFNVDNRESSELQYIGDNAFCNCTSLTIFSGGLKIKEIGVSAFENCSSLANNIIFSGLTSLTKIGVSAFAHCSSYPSINLNECTALTTIGSQAFYGCSGSSNTTITIGKSVSDIGSRAFSYNSNVTTINVNALNSTYRVVEGHCVTKSSPYTLVFGCNGTGNTFTIGTGTTTASAQKIADYAFEGNITLSRTVNFGSNIDSIGAHAFDCCTGMKVSSINVNTTTIGDNAFSGCTSITSMTIRSGLTTVGSSIFSGCTSLTSVTYQSGCLSVFKLGAINIEKAQLAPSIKTIEYAAFSGCTNLSAITSEESATSGLFEMPSSLETINGYSFYNCSKFTTLKLYNCNTLKSYAFNGCSYLTAINYSKTMAEWNSITKESSWKSSSNTITVTCTDGTISV